MNSSSLSESGDSNSLPNRVKNFRPILAKGCRLLERENEPPTILIPEGLIRLTPGALRILKLCTGSMTGQEIISKLQSAHDVSLKTRIENETIDFLIKIYQRKVLDLT